MPHASARVRTGQHDSAHVCYSVCLRSDRYYVT